MRIVRLAWRVARTPGAEHRWRRLVMPLGSAVFILAILISLSLVQMSHQEQARYDARRPRFLPPSANGGSPSDLWSIIGSDEVFGRTVWTIWLQPVDPNQGAPDQYPPGVGPLPPGGVAVSPGLMRLIGGDSETLQSFIGSGAGSDGARDRYSPAIIQDFGIRDGDELLVYRRPPNSYDLSEHPAAMRITGYGPDHDGHLPVGGFGYGGGIGKVTTGAMGTAVVGLLLVPAAVVLIVAGSVGSATRDRRLDLLVALGISRSQFVVLWLVEGLLLAVPGIAAGWLVWFGGWRNLHTVPLIDHRIVSRTPAIASDFDTPFAVGLGAVIVSLLAPLLISVALGLYRYQRPVESSRPMKTSTLSKWRLAPLGLLVFAFAIQHWIGDDRGAAVFLGFVLLILALLPVLLPQLVGYIGRAVRFIRLVPFLLSGRGLERDATGNASPVLGLAVLIAVALGVSGIRALLQTEMPPTAERTDTAAVLVNYRSQDQQAEIQTMSDALSGWLVVRADGNTGSTVRLATTCQELARYFSGSTCEPEAPKQLPEDIKRQLAVALGSGDRNVALVDPADIPFDSFIAVVGDGPYSAFVEEVRNAARQHLIVPAINDNDGGTRAVQSARWLGQALPAPITLLTLATLVAMVDRFINLRQHRRMLLDLGMVPRQLATIDFMQFTITMVTAVVIGSALGIFTVLRVLSAFPETAMPWVEMWTVILATLVVGLLAAGMVLIAGMQRFRRSD